MAQHEKQTARKWKASFQREVERAKRAADVASEEKAKAAVDEEMVQKEMQHETERLYEEQMQRETELEGLKRSVGGAEAAPPASGGDLARLKRELRALKGENASLRSTARRDSAVIASLNDELRSRTSGGGGGPVPAHTSAARASAAAAAASRKRALAPSQGSAGGDERSREDKRSIRYEPHKEPPCEASHATQEKAKEGLGPTRAAAPSRDRLRSSGSGSLEQQMGEGRERCDTGGGSITLGDTVSASNESDNVSVLFGQESVLDKSTKSSGDHSDHDRIRVHAEKLLYWANRASERSSRKDASSTASRPTARSRPPPQDTIAPPNHSRAPSIPATIGLPPRSQSRVRPASPLPPRCPPAPASISDGQGSLPSDKEDGLPYDPNPGEEAAGAFPTSSSSSARGRHKKISLSDTDTIIDDLQDDPTVCCECTASPFSGNDAHSDFYLPKLGMACHCARSWSRLRDERASFSRNPSALSHILRPWQCDFLRTLGVTTADELLRAHKADANDLARRMKGWRRRRGMAAARSRECYVALKIWSRTCKIVLRSIREQRRQAVAGGGGEDEEAHDAILEKPQFLDISFADAHTIASISTLGQFSSVGGGARPFEMMEI